MMLSLMSSWQNSVVSMVVIMVIMVIMVMVVESVSDGNRDRILVSSY